MNLGNIMLNKRGQIQTPTYYIIPLYEIPRIVKSIETGSRLLIARRFGDGKMKND